MPDLAGGRADPAGQALAQAIGAERTGPVDRRPFETEMGIGAPVQLEPVCLCTLGTLSLRLRDTASASAAAARDAGVERFAGRREHDPVRQPGERALSSR